jgi:serine/threonine-protein kinase
MNAWEAGTRIGPYVLVDRVGAGGMGDVWKARDERLDRLIAIKRLHVRPENLAAEARSIAALNHPHICALYDVGPDYMVMELVDGQPLAGPVAPAEAVRLALQIASGLEAAHAKGIVHRDLKPANVLVSSGSAKLLDFGVASSACLAAADTEDATVIGIPANVMGTPAYMAPEQATGADPDPRSDIFSFGAVLYELVTGRRAFNGPSAITTIAAVLHEQPPPPDAPAPLVAIIQRCLEKAPSRRFQSATELRAALEHLSAIPQEEPRPSIAVLPFANLSSDPEQEFFSDGLTEEIINALAQIHGLKVIARTSAFVFKGKQVPIDQIASALGVANLLEGSVRRAANRIRVTAQLVNAADGSHRWSARYDRDFDDVFAVQDDIASSIVTELRGRLGGAPAPRAHRPSLPAYEAFMLGRHHLWQGLASGFAEGQRWYEEALRRDPAYAMPHVGIGELNHIRASGRGAGAREAAAAARHHIAQALTLDPNLPDAHAWAGVMAGTYDFDWRAAARHFQAAVALEPPSPRVRHMHGYFYLRIAGATAAAVAEHRAALAEDPLNLIMRVGLLASLLSDAQSDEARAEFDRLVELAPGFPAIYTLLTRDLLQAPLPDALAFAERLHGLMRHSAGSVGLLAGLLSRSGDAARAARLAREVENLDEYGNCVDVALYHLGRGDADAAFDAMTVAADQQHPFLMMVLVGGPYLPQLRASARWPTFARRVGLA